MKKQSGRRLLKILIPMMLALVCATGCAERPYAASRAVLTFEDAVWVEVNDEFCLLSATFEAEKGLTLEDMQYNFRRGAVLTPGFLAELMKAEKEDLP